MGCVYKAQDTVLKRTVAIKRLPLIFTPFQERPSIYTETGKGPGGPGEETCHMADLPDDTYHYYVDVRTTEGPSKNVTIP